MEKSNRNVNEISSIGGNGTSAILIFQDFFRAIFFIILDFIAGFDCDGTSAVLFSF